MNYSIYRFTLDIHKTKSQVSIPVLFHDTGIQFFITLTDGGRPYFIEDGCRAVFSATKGDGKTLFNDCIIEDNTRIRYDFTEQTTNSEGMMNCEIRLYGKDGELITTPAFVVVVDSRVLKDDEVEESYGESTTLDNIVAYEESRLAGERMRIAAENERVAAEEARAEAEAERVLAEADRRDAEIARNNMEIERSSEEAVRQANEAERVAAFAHMLGSWVAYSAHEDGTDYTWTWSEGQRYIGICNGKYMPKDKTGFVWSKFVDTGVYVGSGDMPSWCDLQIDPDGDVTEIKQTTGQSDIDVMSQKAVSETFANALKGTASGAAVAITDASPIEHEMGVKVRSKNILPYPYNAYKDNTNGMYTDNGDGTITINGVFSGTPTCELCKFTLPNGTYTIGGGVDSSHKVSVRLYDVKTGANIAHSLASAITTFTVNEPTEVKCWIYAAANQTYDNLVIYPMIEEGSTATAYAPYIEDVSTVKVLEVGKNILDVATAPMAGNWHNINTKNWNYERTETGLKYNVINDMNAGWAQIRYQVCPIDMVRGKTITVSFKRTGKEGSNSTYCLLQTGDDEFTNEYTYKGSGFANIVKYGGVDSGLLVNGYGKITATIPADETRKNLFLIFYLGSEMDLVAGDVIEYSNIQIEINDKATEYAPYVAPKAYTVDADGTAKGLVGKGETITLYTDTAGAVLDCTYNKDANKAVNDLFTRIAALEAAVLN